MKRGGTSRSSDGRPVVRNWGLDIHEPTPSCPQRASSLVSLQPGQLVAGLGCVPAAALHMLSLPLPPSLSRVLIVLIGDHAGWDFGTAPLQPQVMRDTYPRGPDWAPESAEWQARKTHTGQREADHTTISERPRTIVTRTHASRRLWFMRRTLCIFHPGFLLI